MGTIRFLCVKICKSAAKKFYSLVYSNTSKCNKRYSPPAIAFFGLYFLFIYLQILRFEFYRVKNLRTELFTFLSLFFQGLIVFQHDLFIRIVYFFVRFIQTKRLFDVIHRIFVILQFISCQRSLIDRFNVIRIHDDCFIIYKNCLFPALLTEET